MMAETGIDVLTFRIDLVFQFNQLLANCVLSKPTSTRLHHSHTGLVDMLMLIAKSQGTMALSTHISFVSYV